MLIELLALTSAGIFATHILEALSAGQQAVGRGPLRRPGKTAEVFPSTHTAIHAPNSGTASPAHRGRQSGYFPAIGATELRYNCTENNVSIEPIQLGGHSELYRARYAHCAEMDDGQPRSKEAVPWN